MARRCSLTGKRPNIAHKVSHSNIKTIQKRSLWLEEEQRFVTLKLSTRAIRTLRKKSLAEFAKEMGVDLSKF